MSRIDHGPNRTSGRCRSVTGETSRSWGLFHHMFFAALPEELGKRRRVPRLAEHAVAAAAVRSKIFIGAPCHRSPAQRLVARPQPFPARQEQTPTAGQTARGGATPRRQGAVLDA